MASKPVPVKKKSTISIADSQEASSTKIKKDPDSHKVIVTASTTSLSGSCDLQYQLGINETGDWAIRIHSSSGTGRYSQQWSSLDESWACLKDWPHGPVTAKALFPMFKYRSINTPGYLTSVLAHIGVLTPSQEKPRHFDLVDDDQFAVLVAKLKATHRSPTKKKAKAKP